MGEAVRTMASPAATWAIVVVATCLALFMAMAVLAANHFQIREHRRMRKLGIGSFAGDALEMEISRAWPSLSEALFEAAGAGPPAAVGAAAWTQAGYTAAGHDFPAQVPAQRREQEPAEHPAAAQRATAQYAGAPEAEAPTEPIPAQRAPAGQGMQDAAAGRHERADAGSAGEVTRPDLPAQERTGRHAMPLPAQRTGESDRAERSFAGPAPQDDDEDEQ